MPIVDGCIRCSRCRESKPINEFSPSTVKNGCGNCRVCQQLHSRAWEKANPEKVSAARRKSYRRDLEASRARVRKKRSTRRAANPEADRAYQRNWRASASPEIRARLSAQSAEYRRRNPIRALGYDLARYGLTAAEYEVLLAAQGGVCACCGAKANRSGKRLFVDHDHTTGAIRGLLCNRCNAGIGHLGDTIEGVRRALAYLERPQSTTVQPAPAIRINLLRAVD